MKALLPPDEDERLKALGRYEILDAELDPRDTDKSRYRQHLWNPGWPPHAKFHNAQTMLMGVFAGSPSLCLLLTSHPLTLRPFLFAAAAASLYWVNMVLAPFFPGTAWYDPEFKDATARPLGLNPQQILSYVHCLLIVLAIVLFNLWASGRKTFSHIPSDHDQIDVLQFLQQLLLERRFPAPPDRSSAGPAYHEVRDPVFVGEVDERPGHVVAFEHDDLAAHAPGGLQRLAFEFALFLLVDEREGSPKLVGGGTARGERCLAESLR